MGHTIDDLGYDKSPKNEKFVRAEYEKAAKYLNLLSSGNAFGQVSEDELESLRRQLEEAKQGQNDRVAELEEKNTELDAKYERLRLLIEAMAEEKKSK
jgi:sRNA-binding protein